MHRRPEPWLLACALLACARPPGNLGASRPPGAIVSELDGVVLIIDVQPNPVGAGERPSFLAELRNERDKQVEFTSGGCAFANLRVTIPTPWEPTGRTWSGREGWFKDYLLKHAYGPGGAAAFSPIDATLMSTPCVEDVGNLLQPTETLTADFTGAIDSFMTTYSHASTMPFSITVDFDPQGSPPPIEPGFTGIPPRFFPEYRHLTASGVLTIEGRPAAVLSAGQAIDALLDDERFTAWLENQELPTCRTANLFLDAGGPIEDGGPIEGGAAWYIQLWCETDIERHGGAAQVDAATGEIRRFETCDDPCE